MTHRERVIAALEHREPDRLPMDLGSSGFTGIVRPGYDRLREYLGFGGPGTITNRSGQQVELDEQILKHLDVDVRGFTLSDPERTKDVELDDITYRDEWGVTRRKPPGCHYYEICGVPLAGDISAADIARFPLPDATDPGRARGLREKALRLRQETDYAVLFNARLHLVHQTQYLRGFEDWYMDLGQNHDLFLCLMEAVLEVMLEMNRQALEAVGDLIDVVAMGDDVGLQDRPICSVPMYRKLIRPFQARIVEFVRKYTQAPILYHTCGSVYKYIPDFIDIGINALNPIQVSAANMEPARLKREFGDRMTFWGGIDTQRLLPMGSPEEVRAGVRSAFEAMGAGGGYVMAAVHNVQPDVPPENILAMFEAGRECRYKGR